MTHPAYRIDGRDADEAAFYATACDPRRSVVVEACAGAGKTWMLVSRILRALLDGTPPQSIVALTFTRKAAGEMRQRLDDWLREFAAVAPDDAGLERLAAELRRRGLDAAAAHRLAPALPGLHEQVLRGGRRVAIHSFHAWFLQLLAAAPLALLRALRLPPQPQLLEEPEDLRDALFARFHAAVHADASLRETYVALVARRRLRRVEDWLVAAWRRRIEFERADSAGVVDASVPPAVALWPECAGLAVPQALVQRAPLAAGLAALARVWATHRNATPRNAAAALALALEESDPRRAFALAFDALHTQQGAIKVHLPDEAHLHAASDALHRIAVMARQQDAHEEHQRMARLTRVLLAEYRELKHERALADMGDLETAAHALLTDPVASGWVQERLDARVTQLLVDEFQDTSALQWQALHAWLAGYAGAGGGASGQQPLAVFIVGDPKQSIYRFRRAEPRVFEAARRFVAEALGGAVLECDHTRRCAPAVLGAVNEVFGQAAAGDRWGPFRVHTTARDAVEGRVGRLPDAARAPASPRGRDDAPYWRDTLTEPRHEPEEQARLAEARGVAATIAARLAGGRRGAEVIVLARRREPLRVVADALAEHRIAAAMPEATLVGAEPEALDLLAALDVLASRGHDLSLARALKSPLFGCSDDDLLALAGAARTGPRAPWWDALHADATPRSAALERARGLFAGWAAAMDWLPPHDLLDRIVHESDAMARFAAAVPPARRAGALRAIEQLLEAALEVDGARYATPYAFVRALRTRPVKAKPATSPDAVRLMTVHGAKGLEAPVVFLVDAAAGQPRADTGVVLVDWPVDADAPRRVAFFAGDEGAPASLAELHATEQADQAREELNALYVAMTRAGDELLVSRTVARNGAAPAASWWRRVEAALPTWQPPVAPAAGPGGAWATVEVPELPALQARRAAGGAPAPAAAQAPADDPAAAALGSAVHRVLEWLAGRPADAARREHAARAAVHACGLAEGKVADVLRLAGSVLDSPQCARFFDPQAFAWAGNEVPVVAAGAPGRIDRLVAFDEEGHRTWWVLDYKLARAPEALEAHRGQLARYAAAVAALQPGDRVRTAFVAAGGRVVEVTT